ncbi:MAG: hypothetical protein LBR52_04730 [Prevotellaceae bacterium]|jgi:hypothetical protein|nr:hypothetical protein [Prevotellaceae bacterium]
MLNLKCKIKIDGEDNKNIEFDYVNDIEIKTSRSDLTDTAVIKVPAKMHRKGKLLESSLKKKEGRVSIEIGYEEHGLQPVFTGYLTGIKNNETLLELSCENEMYSLKNQDVSGRNIEKDDLKKFLEEYIKDVNDNELFFPGINIEKEMKMSQVLNLIKEKYPYLKFYFKEGAFYAIEEGMPDTDRKATVFDLSRNMIFDKLKYEKSEDKKNCVCAVSLLDNFEVLRAYSPEQGWEEAQIYAPTYDGDKIKFVKNGYTEEKLECNECKTPEDLQKYIDKIAENKNAARMTGTFTAFGIPFVRKGEIVTMRGEGKEWNNKRFIVEEVNYKFGVPTKDDKGGYRQIITLGREIQS